MKTFKNIKILMLILAVAVLAMSLVSCDTCEVHELVLVSTNADATCKTEGSQTFVCANCGTSVEESIPRTNDHDFGAWSTVTNATATTDGLKAVITAAGKTWTIDAKDFGYEVGSSGPRYIISFKGLNPAQMRDVVTVKVYDGDTVVSDTATYSIESYGLSSNINTVNNLAPLVEAMARYGRSAKNYLG